MNFLNQGHVGLPDPAQDYLGYARVRIIGIDSFNWTHAPDFVHTGFTSHPASQPASVKLMFACQLCSGTADFLTSLFSIKI